MQPFLQRLTHVVLAHHGTELDRICIVLPGKRSGTFMRKYLAEECTSTLWSPQFHDVGSFLARLAEMRQGGSMELLFLLYEAYRSLNGSNAEPLDEFLQWAPTTLRDMSEVDAHALDLDTVYRDLRSYYEIEDWGSRLGEESPGQVRSSEHWRQTGTLHKAFAELMRQRGVGTSGAVARSAMERVERGEPDIPWKAVWLAGLNALEPATTRVIKALQAKGLAFLAWDADRHYLDDPEQEAGQYLRRSIAALGAGTVAPGTTIREADRHFVHSTVPNDVAQTTWAGTKLAALTAEERTDTAIVLADEGLLMPLLASLPGDMGPINVTMGMPLEALPIHGCTEAFLALHAGQRKFGQYHAGEVERLLLHPFLHQAGATARAIGLLRATKRTRLPHTLIIDLAQEAGMELCQAAKAALQPIAHVGADMPERMTALLAWAQRLAGNDKYRTEQVFQMAKLQRKLDLGLKRMGTQLENLDSYSTLRMKLLREERIAFFGEPLKGAQVMGVLETRAIDHKRIVLLGASEGTFPGGGKHQSWIPYTVRLAHGLPLRSDADAIAAYHFQRMMQHAQHVDVVHGAGEGPGSGGTSRFILQWKNELDGSSNTSFSSSAPVAPFSIRSAPRISIPKDARILEQFARIQAAGLSPSALAMWLRCPLDLYFTRVLGIRTADEVDGRLGSDVLGEAVHAVLEDVVRPMLGHPMDAAQLRGAGRSVHQQLITKLAKTFPEELLLRGHFRLRIEMASRALESHLQAEADRCSTMASIPLALEHELSAELRPGVLIKGRVDRVEVRNGIHHILDLKTGAVDGNELKIPALERAHFTAKRSQALQLLVYGWAYLKNTPGIDHVRTGILPIQKASEAEGLLLSIARSPQLMRTDMPAVETLLNTIVDEMMDPTIALEHSSESTYCKACLTA
ncbi:MAG: PD-(D/E)XK nuclease family protein [Flavobacteriales bacterium]